MDGKEGLKRSVFAHLQLPEEARELDKELRANTKEKNDAVRAQDFEKVIGNLFEFSIYVLFDYLMSYLYILVEVRVIEWKMWLTFGLL